MVEDMLPRSFKRASTEVQGFCSEILTAPEYNENFSRI